MDKRCETSGPTSATGMSGRLVASVRGLEQLGRSFLNWQHRIVYGDDLRTLYRDPRVGYCQLWVPLIILLPISPKNPRPPLRTDAAPAAAMADSGPTEPAAAASSPSRVSDPQPETEEAASSRGTRRADSDTASLYLASLEG